MDFAGDLVRLSGGDPDGQPIHTVGLRPGEKLYEEVFYATEHVVPTISAKALRATEPLPPLSIREDVNGPLDLANGDDEPVLAEALLADVRGVDAPEPDQAAERASRALRFGPAWLGHDELAAGPAQFVQ